MAAAIEAGTPDTARARDVLATARTILADCLEHPLGRSAGGAPIVRPGAGIAAGMLRGATLTDEAVERMRCKLAGSG